MIFIAPQSSQNAWSYLPTQTSPLWDHSSELQIPQIYSLQPTLKFNWHSLNFLELVCSATSSMHFTSTKLCKTPKVYFFSRHIITLFTFSINETKKLLKLTSIKPHLTSNTLSPNNCFFDNALCLMRKSSNLLHKKKI